LRGTVGPGTLTGGRGAARDERTREINAYIEKLRRRIEERKAAEQKAEA
jgi:hypothetical protein